MGDVDLPALLADISVALLDIAVRHAVRASGLPDGFPRHAGQAALCSLAGHWSCPIPGPDGERDLCAGDIVKRLGMWSLLPPPMPAEGTPPANPEGRT